MLGGDRFGLEFGRVEFEGKIYILCVRERHLREIRGGSCPTRIDMKECKGQISSSSVITDRYQEPYFSQIVVKWFVVH